MTTQMITQHIDLLAIILGAYFIRGITGFGSGLIAVPLLAFSHSLQFVVPLVMSLDFVASFLLGSVGGKQADWKEIKLLLPFGLIGASLGIFALLRFPSSSILIALALFVMFFGVRNILGIQPQNVISRLWAVPAGLIGSSAGALFGTSAPPYIIYLTHRIQDKSAVRATFSWLFVIDSSFRLCLLMATGLLLNHNTQLAITLGLLPMMIGLYLGNKVHLNISSTTMLKLIGVALIASGTSLIAKVVF